MADEISNPAAIRFAVVTGGNKGIGFEICKQLASYGILVVLTARDERRGVESLEKLRGFGLSHFLLFHQLDVTDAESVALLVNFIKTRLGKLDILINNAGYLGVDGDALAIRDKIMGNAARVNSLGENEDASQENSIGEVIENYEVAEKCLNTNYYGAKRMIEAFVPLLQLSSSPRIINVSSFWGKLMYLPNQWAVDVLGNAENHTEERIDEVINEFLKDFKEDSLEEKKWPPSFPAYVVSKAVLNAYTRHVAQKYPTICINSVCPGRVKTDLSCYTGVKTALQGAEGPVKLALSPHGGPSGVFFIEQKISSF